MDYISTNFHADGSTHFPFRTWTNTYIHRQTKRCNWKLYLCHSDSCWSTTTNMTTNVIWPSVWDYPGELVAEETFTHSHLTWSSIILYLLPPSTTIHSILPVQFTCPAVFLHNLCPSLLLSTWAWHTPYISSPNRCFQISTEFQYPLWLVSFLLLALTNLGLYDFSSFSVLQQLHRSWCNLLVLLQLQPIFIDPIHSLHSPVLPWTPSTNL